MTCSRLPLGEIFPLPLVKCLSQSLQSKCKTSDTAERTYIHTHCRSCICNKDIWQTEQWKEAAFLWEGLPNTHWSACKWGTERRANFVLLMISREKVIWKLSPNFHSSHSRWAPEAKQKVWDVNQHLRVSVTQDGIIIIIHLSWPWHNVYLIGCWWCR